MDNAKKQKYQSIANIILHNNNLDLLYENIIRTPPSSTVGFIWFAFRIGVSTGIKLLRYKKIIKNIISFKDGGKDALDFCNVLLETAEKKQAQAAAKGDEKRHDILGKIQIVISDFIESIKSLFVESDKNISQDRTLSFEQLTANGVKLISDISRPKVKTVDIIKNITQFLYDNHTQITQVNIKPLLKICRDVIACYQSSQYQKLIDTIFSSENNKLLLSSNVTRYLANNPIAENAVSAILEGVLKSLIKSDPAEVAEKAIKTLSKHLALTALKIMSQDDLSIEEKSNFMNAIGMLSGGGKNIISGLNKISNNSVFHKIVLESQKEIYAFIGTPNIKFHYNKNTQIPLDILQGATPEQLERLVLTTVPKAMNALDVVKEGEAKIPLNPYDYSSTALPDIEGGNTMLRSLINTTDALYPTKTDGVNLEEVQNKAMPIIIQSALDIVSDDNIKNYVSNNIEVLKLISYDFMNKDDAAIDLIKRNVTKDTVIASMDVAQELLSNKEIIKNVEDKNYIGAIKSIAQVLDKPFVAKQMELNFLEQQLKITEEIAITKTLEGQRELFEKEEWDKRNEIKEEKNAKLNVDEDGDNFSDALEEIEDLQFAEVMGNVAERELIDNLVDVKLQALESHLRAMSGIKIDVLLAKTRDELKNIALQHSMSKAVNILLKIVQEDHVDKKNIFRDLSEVLKDEKFQNFVKGNCILIKALAINSIDSESIVVKMNDLASQFDQLVNESNEHKLDDQSIKNIDQWLSGMTNIKNMNILTDVIGVLVLQNGGLKNWCKNNLDDIKKYIPKQYKGYSDQINPDCVEEVFTLVARNSENLYLKKEYKHKYDDTNTQNLSKILNQNIIDKLRNAQSHGGRKEKEASLKDNIVETVVNVVLQGNVDNVMNIAVNYAQGNKADTAKDIARVGRKVVTNAAFLSLGIFFGVGATEEQSPKKSNAKKEKSKSASNVVPKLPLS